MTTELEISGIAFDTVNEAIQYACASGRGAAVAVEGIKGYLVVDEKVADLLATKGVSFACYYDHEMPDGSSRVISVPVG